jgi:hypothetical protein
MCVAASSAIIDGEFGILQLTPTREGGDTDAREASQQANPASGGTDPEA